MSGFDRFGPPDDGSPGFRVVAGEMAGLNRLLLAVGRLPQGDHGPQHLHLGEEILHVVSGRLSITVGSRTHECGPGDVIAVPGMTLHGFDVIEAAVLEVVAEQRIGTFYRQRDDDGAVRLVEVHRPDMPWGRPPPPGISWTTDAELRRILRRLDTSVGG